MLAFTDAHLDIAWSCIGHGRDFVTGHPDAAVGLPAMLEGGVTLACATLFCARPEEEETPEELAEQQLAYYDALPDRSDGRVIWPADVMDVGQTRPGAGVCLIGLMEGCEPLGDVSDLAAYYKRGVRVVGLTWNRNNRWAGGCEGGDTGLTPEGVELVKEIDRLGMIHDVSHLSRTSVDDLLGTARGPVIASHVGTDAVFAHPRNLTDEHLKAIAQRGGVASLVLYEKFLTDGRATIDDAVRHLLHMVSVCGPDAVGIGSDMDGGFGPDRLPTGLRSAADLPKLAAALESAGLPAADVAKIVGGNLRRVLTAVM